MLRAEFYYEPHSSASTVVRGKFESWLSWNMWQHDTCVIDWGHSPHVYNGVRQRVRLESSPCAYTKAEAAVKWLLLQARPIKPPSRCHCRSYYYANNGCMQADRCGVLRLEYVCHLLSLITDTLGDLWFSSPCRASARGSHLFTIWSKYTKQLPL